MQDLQIDDLGKAYVPDPVRCPPPLRHTPRRDEVSGGNTSLRYEDVKTLAWKGRPDSNGSGYFQRNRDLGQVFNVPPGPDLVLEAIVLRTGRGSNAVMPGAPGAAVYLQFFEVGVRPGESIRIDDNGTPAGARATHGFDVSLHRADDVVRGETYRPILRLRGGRLPDWTPTNRPEQDQGNGQPFGEQPGHLRYFRIRIAGPKAPVLRANRRYAFVIGFESPGKDRGLGLANQHWVHDAAAPTFPLDSSGNPRWAVRREGNGKLPPTMIGGVDPPSDRKQREALVREALFAKNHWDSLSPTSEGYPDVDTYRTLEFALEVHAARTPGPAPGG